VKARNNRRTRKAFDCFVSFVWATAPYLNNGSVAKMGDFQTPPGARPASFMLGSREYDTQKLGYITVISPETVMRDWKLARALARARPAKVAGEPS
jgi:hypothetical protein